MKNFKNEKGSLALFVTIAMLFFMSFLLALFLSTSNEQKTQLAVTARIKQTYEKDLDNVEEIYKSFVGTDKDIPIYTSEQLKKVGTGENVYIAEVGKYYTFNLDSNYILKNNIELNKYKVEEDGTITFQIDAEQWIPIGTSEKPFVGIFDGNGYKISGLYIDDASLSYQGLFGYNNGTIKNIIIDNGKINVGEYFGIISSQNLENGIIDGCTNKININVKDGSGSICAFNFGKILNCINEGDLTNSSTYDVGGICSHLEKDNAIIKNCVNKGNITGKKAVGGIVGYIKYGGTVENCYNNGKISSSDTERSDIGGIVGLINGNNKININNCYNLNIVTSEINIGGIVGRNLNSNTVISNCYNKGNIISNRTVIDSDDNKYHSNIGGILGYSASNVIIKQCYNIGKIDANGIEVGGILGIADNTKTLSNCYYLIDTATGGINGADATGQAEVKTSDEMRKSDFVTLLNNGENNWKIVAGKNDGYPILSWQN